MMDHIEEQAELTPDQIRRAAQQFASRAGMFCSLLVVYGLFRLYMSGTGLEFMYYTYVPIVLGIAGVFGETMYGIACFETEKSWWAAFYTWAAMVTYIAGVYMVGFLGFYGLYTLASEFAIWPLIRCLMFVVFGFKSVNSLYISSELAKKAST